MTPKQSAVLPRPIPGAAPRPRVPEPVRFELDNGLRLLVVPWRQLPQVAARLVLPAGSAADPPGAEGAASLVGALLTEGTERFSPDELNERIDRLGASLSVQVGHDFAEVDLFTLGETLAEGFELLAEIVMRPVFPESEVERLRAETLDSLDARLDEPANIADDRVAVALYGEGHPYATLAMGTPDGVCGVERSALAHFHAVHYRPRGTTLVVAGDVDPQSLLQTVTGVLGDWGGAPPAVAYPPPRPETWNGEVIRLGWPDAAQGEIRVASPGLPRNSPRWIPAAVANYLLGGSTITGRLGANLREDKGWTYGVRSGFGAGVLPGSWVVETAVDGEVVDRALEEIELEIQRFVDELVGEEELHRARESIILSLPRAFETPGRIVGRFSIAEAYGLGEDYWRRFADAVAAVTAEEVREIAREHFTPESLHRVVVGPE